MVGRFSEPLEMAVLLIWSVWFRFRSEAPWEIVILYLFILFIDLFYFFMLLFLFFFNFAFNPQKFLQKKKCFRAWELGFLF